MECSARESYLATEVMTATPQKLQLMLIEAAIRSAERARQRWHAGEGEGACEELIRAQEVVGEMLASLNSEVAPDLVKKVASVYVFIFRSLMEANYERNETKLDDALRILKIERETWCRVCEQLAAAQEPAGGEAAAPAPRQPASAAAALPPALPSTDHPPTGHVDIASTTTSFSLEA
ncbi:MAG: flagellar protein FliS [Pirellulales bacterium]|nr:flagellar protein FliS [Pirellulales bacterium]